MRVAVTGATGFLGRWLVEHLLDEGISVRALLRSPSPPRWAAERDVTWVRGDLSTLPSDFPGPSTDTVFHLAAQYAAGPRSAAELREANVEGTRRLLDASVRDQVPRFLHCSTMGTCAPRADGRSATEGDHPPPSSLSPYAATKLEAERLALAETRLEVVVANPAAPIGAYDGKPSVTGERVLDVLRGRFPRLLEGPINYVPARAVASGLIQVSRRGRPAERYLLGGENLSPQEFLERMSSAAGVPLPKRTALDRLRGRRRLTPGHLAIDDAKARGELGYDPGDLDTAMREATIWFRRARVPEIRMTRQQRR